MHHTSGPPSPFFDLLHLDIRYPIAKRIYHFLPIADIISVSKTCRSLENVYRSLLPTEWNVDKTLSRFVSNPRRFRSHLAKNNAIVAGNVPLQFFERVVWKDQPLVVLVEDSSTTFATESPFAGYLIDTEGYKLADNLADGGDENLCEHKWSEWTLSKQSDRTSTETVIRIIPTAVSPIQVALERSSSTAVVNVFTWNKAFSMYPLAAFVHHDAFVTRGLDNRSVDGVVEAYEQRGWKFRHLIWPDASNSEVTTYPLRPLRCVGDCYTWTISFDTRDVDSSGACPDYVVEHANFSVRAINRVPERGESSFKNYCFSADNFQSCVLRYRYTTGSNAWYLWLKKVMSYKALVQLHALASADRPEHFDIMVSDTQYLEHYEVFEKPKTWNYCDDEIPRLYEQWKKTYCSPGR